MPAEIRHSLDLVLRLVDTASGRPVPDRDVVLLRDGEPVHPMVKDAGTFVFLGRGRRDFRLTVRCRGFEEAVREVAYGALDSKLPMLLLHLIPGKGYRAPFPCLGLEGSLPGVTSLAAVRLADRACLIREFEPRKKLLTLFNPHKLELDRVFYALLDPDGMTWEPFQLVKRLSDQQFKLDRVLETPFKNYYPITPVVFGMTGPDSLFRLRVRSDGTDARWLLRWESGDGPHFKALDLTDPGAAIP